MKKNIPSFLQVVFPSYEVERLNLEEDEKLIITRVLNYGVWRDIKWLYSVYTEEDIKEVLLNPSRGVWFPKVLNFWETVLNIKIPKKKREKAIFRLYPERW